MGRHGLGYFGSDEADTAARIILEGIAPDKHIAPELQQSAEIYLDGVMTARTLLFDVI